MSSPETVRPWTSGPRTVSALSNLWRLIAQIAGTRLTSALHPLDASEHVFDTVSGFRERRWKTVQQMKPGDYLVCYLTGVSRWIGVLEVVSEAYRDSSPIWEDDVFPCRLRVRSVATLTPETAVPVFELREQLQRLS